MEEQRDADQQEATQENHFGFKPLEPEVEKQAETREEPDTPAKKNLRGKWFYNLCDPYSKAV